MKMKKIIYLFLTICIFLPSCSGDDKEKTRPITLDCLYGKKGDIHTILDTAKVGNEDGTYPQANYDKLKKAYYDLDEGLSKAKGDMFSLQYEVDNYCLLADKEIKEFLNSRQESIPVGQPAELIVYGVDKKGRIEFGSSPDFGGGQAFTVESWIKYEDGFFESAIGDFIATFAYRQGTGGNIIEGWMINFMGPQLRTTIGMGPQVGRVLEWGKVYPQDYGNWHHIAFSYDDNADTEQLKMYLDGELFFAKTNDIFDGGGVLQKYQPNSSAEVKMWAFMEPTDNSRCMTGYIKKFRMWKTVKTQDEIKTLMGGDVVGTESNLICAWDFTTVVEDPDNIADKTGRHKAKLVGLYKWKRVSE